MAMIEVRNAIDENIPSLTNDCVRKGSREEQENVKHYLLKNKDFSFEVAPNQTHLSDVRLQAPIRVARAVEVSEQPALHSVNTIQRLDLLPFHKIMRLSSYIATPAPKSIAAPTGTTTL